MASAARVPAAFLLGCEYRNAAASQIVVQPDGTTFAPHFQPPRFCPGRLGAGIADGRRAINEARKQLSADPSVEDDFFRGAVLLGISPKFDGRPFSLATGCPAIAGDQSIGLAALPPPARPPVANDASAVTPLTPAARPAIGLRGSRIGGLG
jgi:hypothetical protein